jgi:hypothetical protein
MNMKEFTDGDPYSFLSNALMAASTFKVLLKRILEDGLTEDIERDARRLVGMWEAYEEMLGGDFESVEEIC